MKKTNSEFVEFVSTFYSAKVTSIQKFPHITHRTHGDSSQSPYPYHTHTHGNPHGNPHTHGSPEESTTSLLSLRFGRCVACVRCVLFLLVFVTCVKQEARELRALHWVETGTKC